MNLSTVNLRLDRGTLPHFPRGFAGFVSQIRYNLNFSVKTPPGFAIPLPLCYTRQAERIRFVERTVEMKRSASNLIIILLLVVIIVGVIVYASDKQLILNGFYTVARNNLKCHSLFFKIIYGIPVF